MDLVWVLIILLICCSISMAWRWVDRKRGLDCYILDYECFRPTDDRKLDTGSCGNIIMRNKNLGLAEYQFLLKAIVSAGIGEETYGPGVFFSGEEENPSLEDGILEMEEFFQGTIQKLLSRSGISPQQINLLVVNVSMISTTPSLAARIIRRYKMRDNIKVYNLTGMGCSASLISVNIVQNIFKNVKNQYALVVSSESLTPNWYSGNNKSMILANCLFRSGGCSILLTNAQRSKHDLKFKLKCLVRTHHGFNDESYNSCLQKEDEQGHRGFHLDKNLPKAASRVLVDNLKVISPLILPVTELLRFIIMSSPFVRKWRSSKPPAINMKSGVDHFCVHPGGKAVIDGIGLKLGLSAYDLEPARMTLHRFGNTSASSLWYVLGYMVAKKRMKKGDRVLMVSFGAGFKCNSCLWQVVRDLGEEDNVWTYCIDGYPLGSLVNPFMDKYGWMNNEDAGPFTLSL